jgi:3-oxoacyl-[acyl-carrier-protein] synthase III
LSASLRDVHVAGTGHYLPENTVTNADLFAMPAIRSGFDVEKARGSLRTLDPAEAARLDPGEVFDRWALQLTGVAERRVLPDGTGETTEAMCAAAGRQALAHAGMDASELDFMVVASLTAFEDVPNSASTVAARIGRTDLPGYVMNAACAGFIHALATAHAFVAAGIRETVLVIAGEALSRITNYDDPKTAVLFGDGSGAAIVTSRPARGRLLGPPVLEGEYSPDHLNLTGLGWGDPAGPEHKLSMAGGASVLRHAIRTMEGAADRALAPTPIGWDDVDFVIPHQANERITQGLERSLALRKGRVLHRIAEIGNVSASTVPIVLDELLRGRHGELPRPARIVLTAVGGGYTSGAAVLEWDAGAS